MKRFAWIGMAGILIWFSSISTYGKEPYIEEYEQAVNLEKLDDDLENITRSYGMKEEISFQDIFRILMTGDVESALQSALEKFYQGMLSEVMENRILLIKLMLLIVIAAIFHNYSSILKVS